MGMKRALSLLLAIAGLCATASSSISADADIDLKNATESAVSVPLGTDNGVTRDSDFQVAGAGGAILIHPVELFGNRFWSQPLSDEDYARVRVGMKVSPVHLDRAVHLRVRAEGQARRAEIRERLEEARRQAARKEAEELKNIRDRLAERRDLLEERISAAEKSMIDEETRMYRAADSEDSAVIRALQAIQDLADRKDELQAQREALPRTSPRGDAERLSAEIKRLNERISFERDSVRLSRERKRLARSAFQSARQEWKGLLAERNALQSEIASIDRKMQDLSERR